MQTIKNLILFLVAKATQPISDNIWELQAFMSCLFQILLGPLYAAAPGCQPYHTSCSHILL